MLFNKVNSDIGTHLEIIKMKILEESPTLCVLNESNVKKTDNIENEFKEYDIINKYENNRLC